MVKVIKFDNFEDVYGLVAKDHAIISVLHRYDSDYIVTVVRPGYCVGSDNFYLRTVRRPYLLSAQRDVVAALVIHHRREAIRAARNLAKDRDISEIWIIE